MEGLRRERSMTGDSERRGKERVSRYPACGTWVLPSGMRPPLSTVLCFAPSARGSGASSSSQRSGSRQPPLPRGAREPGEGGREGGKAPPGAPGGGGAASPGPAAPGSASPAAAPQVRERSGTERPEATPGGAPAWPRPSQESPPCCPSRVRGSSPSGAARAWDAGSLASTRARIPAAPAAWTHIPGGDTAHRAPNASGTHCPWHPMLVAPTAMVLVPLPPHHGCVCPIAFTSVLLPSQLG